MPVPLAPVSTGVRLCPADVLTCPEAYARNRFGADESSKDRLASPHGGALAEVGGQIVQAPAGQPTRRGVLKACHPHPANGTGDPAPLSTAMPCIRAEDERLVPACPDLVAQLQQERQRITMAIQELQTSRNMLDVVTTAAPHQPERQRDTPLPG
ncbi:hypothetical protein [Microtetraspora sp. NBRC 13810]|uniref:hypothetical protein n=1 Tax=Microtetraspora sp. NBRC 13810 TaxID=3030990 RepID=UPI0025562816|nr:hypothetical protein [Microtetraspora sp. NBRC 13810]